MPTSPAFAVRTGWWEAAGSMSIGRGDTHALRMGDGRVLVVGNDVSITRCDRRDARETEIWDPARGAWTAGPMLGKARGHFATVVLADGRPMVAGGVNGDGASFSSAYLFDPWASSPGWARTGLLGSARTSPGAAALPDGGVLLAGGYYVDGSEAAICGAPGDLCGVNVVSGRSTASLYDPVAGTWARTGSMRDTRVDPAVATLADGRVLVVGSDDRDEVADSYIDVAAGAVDTAELYDPTTGRFEPAGRLPALDLSAARAAYPGEDAETLDGGWVRPGTLVALPDGDALLFGRSTAWSGTVHEGDVAESWRFDADAKTWHLIDRVVTGYTEDAGDQVVLEDGHGRPGAIAVALADGTVLVTGGYERAYSGPHYLLLKAIADAWLYHPGTGTWVELPSMPGARADAAAARLADGSVLVVGGRSKGDAYMGVRRCKAATGLASAIRFVPLP